MFTKSKPKYQLLLEDELTNALQYLRTQVTGSDPYVAALSYVERLRSMVEKDNQPAVSKETLLIVGANLLGILMIIKHEDVNVLSSKALNFVMRTR